MEQRLGGNCGGFGRARAWLCPQGAASRRRRAAAWRGANTATTLRELASQRSALEALDYQTSMNLHKVRASELAVSTVMSAMQACGLSGYRNDSEFSLGRHLRDVLSSPIMINNDRILANLADASLLNGVPTSLRG